ncbi:MAG: tetratricopeptide repeat protein [Pirellulaceae bacterium]
MKRHIQLVLFSLFLLAGQIAPAIGRQESVEQPVQDEDTNNVVESLVKEISDLTPGGTGTDPKLSEGVAAAVRAFVESDPSGTYEQIDRLRSAFPQLPPASLVLAALHYTTGNPQEGNQRLEEAAATAPELPTIYNAFARVAINQGRKTDARVLLEKSVQLAGDDRWSESDKAFFKKSHDDAMADLLILRSDFGAARKYLEDLLASDPEMAKSILRLAQLDFRQGKMDAALARLEAFKKLTPEARVPELMLATMLVQNGKEGDAGEWVQKALDKYPNDQKVVLEYIDWMIAHEEFASVDALLTKKETEIGMLPAVLMLKGKMAFARQQYGESEKLFSTLRNSEPANLEVATMLALSMAESGDQEKLKKASEIVQQTMQLQPRNPVVMAVLGYVALKLGNMPAAGEWLNRASQGGNVPAETAYYIALFLESQGDKDRALELINTALSNRGLFLYRQSALDLQKQLSQKDDSLSAPGSGN